jgi:hypothetical protein
VRRRTCRWPVTGTDRSSPWCRLCKLSVVLPWHIECIWIRYGEIITPPFLKLLVKIHLACLALIIIINFCRLPLIKQARKSVHAVAHAGRWFCSRAVQCRERSATSSMVFQASALSSNVGSTNFLNFPLSSIFLRKTVTICESSTGYEASSTFLPVIISINMMPYA